MAAVAQRSMPLQTGTAQICARPDPFQQALIVCPPGFQGKAKLVLARPPLGLSLLLLPRVLPVREERPLPFLPKNAAITEFGGWSPIATNLETMRRML